MTRHRHPRLRRRQPPVRDPGRVHAASSRPLQERGPLRERRRPHQDRGRRGDQRVHPEPDLRQGRAAGRAGGLLPARQPEGAQPPRALRRADPVAARVPRAGVAPEAHGRAGPRPHADVPDARQPARGAHEGGSRADARRDPRFNQWLHETWQFNYQDRIFTTPIITLPIVEQAIEELEWVLERGARAMLVRPAPVPGYKGPRSFALPEFDPFWERVVEADILVALHSSDSGYERFANEWIGGNAEFLPFQPNAFRMLGVVAADRGRGGVADRATARSALPDAQDRRRRERRQLGRAAAEGAEGPVQEDAAGLPREPARGDAPQHPHQPVLGGGLRPPRRAARPRPRAVRLGLSRTPRGWATR